MFKTGDFSRLSQVTVESLRHYDEISLFKPAHIDDLTGYRYYTADQLPRLSRILALKDLGFSLEEISVLLDGSVTAERIREMLRFRERDILQQIEDEKERLARVEVRLKQIETEETVPDYDIVAKRIEPQRAAVMREVIPAYADTSALFGELCGYLTQSGGKSAGPPLAIYYDDEYCERDVDVEVAVPISSPIIETDRIKTRELPEIESAACVVHMGSCETLSETYGALMAWIEENGMRLDGPNRDVYLQHSDTDPDSNVTEIQFPVVKV